MQRRIHNILTKPISAHQLLAAPKPSPRAQPAARAPCRCRRRARPTRSRRRRRATPSFLAAPARCRAPAAMSACRRRTSNALTAPGPTGAAAAPSAVSEERARARLAWIPRLPGSLATNSAPLFVLPLFLQLRFAADALFLPAPTPLPRPPQRAPRGASRGCRAAPCSTRAAPATCAPATAAWRRAARAAMAAAARLSRRAPPARGGLGKAPPASGREVWGRQRFRLPGARRAFAARISHGSGACAAAPAALRLLARAAAAFIWIALSTFAPLPSAPPRRG